MSAPIGSGKWAGLITERGGAPVVAELTAAISGAMSRTLNATTTGSLVVPNEVECDVLDIIEPWRHELHLYRDSESAWIGVPSYPEWDLTKVTITARDLSLWLDHRICPVTQSFSNVSLAVIFQTIFEDAMRDDESPNIALDPVVIEEVGSREIDAQARRMAGEELRELTRSGLDFVMIGRTMHLKSPTNPSVVAGIPGIPGTVSALGVLIDEHVKDADVSAIGPLGTTEAFVLGATQAVEGSAGGYEAAYGLVQGVFTESRIRDIVSATHAARDRVQLTRRPPQKLDVTLLDNCPFSFEDLVPGSFLDVRLSIGCKRIQEIMRLLSVNASFGSGKETVKISMVSIGGVE